MKGRALGVGICALVLAQGVGHRVWAETGIDASTISVQRDVEIPLRDAVELSATLYLPASQTAPVPCVFTLTPYISDTYHDRGMYFAANGFTFLAVDVRGRGNSQGEFRPLIQEAQDGYDVVEWLARQPYCNGKVAMWGGSYAGYDQWATAQERPPHLATIVPVAAPTVGVDFPSYHGIFSPYDVQWLAFVSGRALQQQLFADSKFWTATFRRWFESGAAFASFDSTLGAPFPILHEWLSHPDAGSYWDTYNPTPEQYSQLTIPILTITGMYDANQPGAIDHYRQYMRNASATGRARHFLVIGPWDHAGTRTPREQFGGLKFGVASLLDLGKLHLEWYRWTMQDGPKPEFLRKAVAYYVTGAEKWRYADTLESITATRRAFYLSSAGDGAADIFSSGTLDTKQTRDRPPDHYRYDPADVSGAGFEATVDPDSWVDQQLAYARRGAELVYHTAPFPADVEVSGFFKLSAWIAIDQPDTDFSVAVSEIRADGTSVALSAAVVRARYREGERTPKLVATQAPQLYTFDTFTFASRRISKGSRLRLIFGPCQSIYSEKNYNTGGTVAQETQKVARPVTVRLFHDRAHPSALYVPMATPE